METNQSKRRESIKFFIVLNSRKKYIFKLTLWLNSFDDEGKARLENLNSRSLYTPMYAIYRIFCDFRKKEEGYSMYFAPNAVCFMFICCERMTTLTHSIHWKCIRVSSTLYAVTVNGTILDIFFHRNLYENYPIPCVFTNQSPVWAAMTSGWSLEQGEFAPKCSRLRIPIVFDTE